MVNPLPEFAEPKGGFVVADIENRADGSVICIDTAWRENGKIVHRKDYHWDSWWKWLRATGRNDKRFRLIYAHNGGGWDWLSLVEYLMEDGADLRQHISASLACSKCITLTVKIEDRFTVNFADSLQLLRSSLNELGEKFDVTRKVDIGDRLPEEVLRTNPDLFWRYVEGDTECLLTVLEKALDLLREHVAKIDTFGMTIGSTALKVFKTIGVKEPILTPWCPVVKKLLREGYTGGRVECFRPGYYPDVRVYDVNSLYPYAMLQTAVPVTDRGVWSTSDKYEPGSTGVYEIEWEQANKNLPPVLCKGGRGVYSGSGAYFSPELDLLKSIDPKGSIIVKRGYSFFDNQRIFEPFVKRLYRLRLQHKDGPVDLLCKYLLNSLYGKFGQNPEREKIAVIPLEDIFEMIPQAGEANVRLIDEKRFVHGVTYESDCAFEHVGIAGVITSRARVELYRGLLAASNGRGFRDVLYCDTDSVHTLSEFPPDLVGLEIGQYKLEFHGEGAYAGKKLYSLRNSLREKVRAKGVSIGGRNGARLSFNDIRRVVSGEKIKCEFAKPSTALEVFSGRQKADVFVKRFRTISKTGIDHNEQIERAGEREGGRITPH